LRSIGARLRTVGFQGPFYQGFWGKMRFVFESLVYRHEFVFTATRESLAQARKVDVGDLRIVPADSFAALETFSEPFNREYHPGFSKTWEYPFGWGETARVALLHGRPVGISWIQRGTREGYPTYYGRLEAADARILRVGVVPSARRQGVNTRMLQLILDELIAEGRERVFIECYARNVPSVRTFLRIGFRPVGLLRVLSPPGIRQIIRWESAAMMASTLQRIEAAR
jgi:RimJ/RimL family protein N-acetyltransferase